eukprot:3992070-Pyramimonas_sp.AAC.1
MPSTAVPGKFNGAVECDLMFYRQEHNIFHSIDRCIRFATGMKIPGATMTTILDAYHQCWMQFGPAKVLYSDGEGALNNDTVKAVLEAEGTDFRMRARRQHAATIEAGNGILRHLLRAMEAGLNRLDIPLVFTRLLHEALFAANEVSPWHCLDGNQQCSLTF